MFQALKLFMKYAEPQEGRHEGLGANAGLVWVGCLSKGPRHTWTLLGSSKTGVRRVTGFILEPLASHDVKNWGSLSIAAS